MRGFRWPPPPDGGPRTWGPGPGGPRTGRPALPEPETELVTTPHGVRLERLVTGTGDPVTVFAHGFGNGIATTRPFGSGVTGRKVFFQFRGHGRSDAPAGPWNYLDLARDLRAVADLGGASRAFGASLGAGALCRLLAESPERFEKLVFFLPAVLDQPRGPVARERVTDLLEAVESGDASAVADVVSLELPTAVRNTPAGWSYLRQRLDQLLRDGLADGLATLPEQTPLRDATVLSAVTAPALVIGCAGDDLHPVEVAEQLAAALPQATLHVYDRPGVLWTERADLRERISGFLNE
ncbi:MULTISPECIES: alpha/beta fold hydrolase [unclassified Micromonospora]|uniref:alpha/beta fold hydrolase n=1 Tax=unclassified Micromonospora TaxID=2617518 RepID=UPI000EF47332|nr:MULTISPECIES: alpha/beta hydrolase [unclassified Micromonospora]RLP91800.1 alpha/beta hydrolase [Micromonospora sp. BL4]RLP96805.1 alpha/beta hydrolase [Micromonospora sp. CV4]